MVLDIPLYVPRDGNRDYRIETPYVDFVIDTSRDLPKRIAAGDIDAAIPGASEVAEFEAEKETAEKSGAARICYEAGEMEVIGLKPYLSWKLGILVREDTKDRTFADMLRRLDARDIRYPVVSWTEYPFTQKQMLEETGSLSAGIWPYSKGDIMIVPSSGATESKLCRDYSSFGLEIVSTGETARANSLRSFSETERAYGPVLVKLKKTKKSFVDELIAKLTS